MIRADLSLAKWSGLTITPELSLPYIHITKPSVPPGCPEGWDARLCTVVAILLSKSKAWFSWYPTYVASQPAKAKVAFRKTFTSTSLNGIYPLQKLGLYFLSSIQTVSGIATDCTTDCSLYFSESQELTDVPLKWLFSFWSTFALPTAWPSYCPWKFGEYLCNVNSYVCHMECQESDCGFTWPTRTIFRFSRRWNGACTKRYWVKSFTNKFLIKPNPIREHVTRKFWI